MKRNEAIKLIAVLEAAYPRDPVTDARQELYAQMLGDLDAADAVAAVKRVIARCKWFPTIAEIREEYARAALQAPTADEAWELVLREVRRIGSYHAPTFADERVAAAVRSIGWQNICASTRPGFERAAFVRAYGGLVERELAAWQAPPEARTADERRRLGSGAATIADDPMQLATLVLGEGE